MNNIRILLVEDDENSILLIKKYLSNKSFTILCANNGVDAISLFMRDPAIRLVIMDIKLPILNGFEAAYKMKSIRPKIPILALTAHIYKYSEEEAIKAGFDVYIQKPVSKLELLNVVDTLLSFSAFT